MEQREPQAPQKQDKGFTLVELLIVIVILGILAAVTVIAVGGITDKASDNACDTDQASLITAAELARVDNSLSEAPDLGQLQGALRAPTSDIVAAAAADGVRFTYTTAGDPLVGTLTGSGDCSDVAAITIN